MRAAIDVRVTVQAWLFETFVSLVMYWGGGMEWYEPAFNAVEFFMLGVLQIAIIALVMRAFEKRWLFERTADTRLMRMRPSVVARRCHSRSVDALLRACLNCR